MPKLLRRVSINAVIGERCPTGDAANGKAGFLAHHTRLCPPKRLTCQDCGFCLTDLTAARGDEEVKVACGFACEDDRLCDLVNVAVCGLEGIHDAIDTFAHVPSILLKCNFTSYTAVTLKPEDFGLR